MLKVYVVGFRPDLKHDNPGGTGGFEWYYDREQADVFYLTEVNRAAKHPDEGYEYARWDHEITGGHVIGHPKDISDLSSVIDANLDEAHDAAPVQWHASAA